MIDIYQTINNSVYSKDITECGKNIVLFAAEARKTKNRITLIKYFYENIDNSMHDYYWDVLFGEDSNHYCIYENDAAIWKYIGLTIPAKTTPVKSLDSLMCYGTKIVNDFYAPNGNIIKKDKIVEIMDYLDQQYDFSEKVFCDRKSIFSIMNCCNRNFDSESLITICADKKIHQHLFLYCMNGKSEASPEFVMFHELAHCIHSRWLKATDILPPAIEKFLGSCFPLFNEASKAEQVECFVEVLSMGMICDSPFREYDYHNNIPNRDKKIFKEIFEKIISKI